MVEGNVVRLTKAMFNMFNWESYICYLHSSLTQGHKMIICADDYGLREDIDRAILGLCSLGKLSAVSCMVVFKRCDATALNGLLAHQAKVDIGLHLCLTDEGLPMALPLPECQLPDYKSFFRRALVGKINPQEISRQVRSEEHTSELQSLAYLVCRLLLEKKKIKHTTTCGTKQELNKISTQSYTTQNHHIHQ